MDSPSQQSLNLVSVLRRFCDRLNERLELFSKPKHKSLVTGKSGSPKSLHIFESEVSLTAEIIGQKPHRFTGRYLVEPCFWELGYRYIPEPRGESVNVGDGEETEDAAYPDFRLVPRSEEHQQREVPIVGELKPPGNIKSAKQQLKQDHFPSMPQDSVGIATDGITWRLYRRTASGFERFTPSQVHIKSALHKARKDSRYSSKEMYQVEEIASDLQRFCSIYSCPIGQRQGISSIDDFS